MTEVKPDLEIQEVGQEPTLVEKPRWRFKIKAWHIAFMLYLVHAWLLSIFFGMALLVSENYFVCITGFFQVWLGCTIMYLGVFSPVWFKRKSNIIWWIFVGCILLWLFALGLLFYLAYRI